LSLPGSNVPLALGKERQHSPIGLWLRHKEASRRLWMRWRVDEVLRLIRISVGEVFTAHRQACTIRVTCIPPWNLPVRP